MIFNEGELLNSKVGDNYVHMQFKNTEGGLINRLLHYLYDSVDQNRILTQELLNKHLLTECLITEETKI